MHEYKLNCLIVDNWSCTQKIKVVSILFLFSPFLYCIVLSYVCVSAFCKWCTVIQLFADFVINFLLLLEKVLIDVNKFEVRCPTFLPLYGSMFYVERWTYIIHYIETSIVFTKDEKQMMHDFRRHLYQSIQFIYICVRYLVNLNLQVF